MWLDFGFDKALKLPMLTLCEIALQGLVTLKNHINLNSSKNQLSQTQILRAIRAIHMNFEIF